MPRKQPLCLKMLASVVLYDCAIRPFLDSRANWFWFGFRNVFAFSGERRNTSGCGGEAALCKPEFDSGNSLFESVKLFFGIEQVSGFAITSPL